MKEFKALTVTQLELLEVKVIQIRTVLNQAQDLQNQAQDLQRKNAGRIERMKTELGIPAKEAKGWRFSKDGKKFEREKQIKKKLPGRNAGKGKGKAKDKDNGKK